MSEEKQKLLEEREMLGEYRAGSLQEQSLLCQWAEVPKLEAQKNTRDLLSFTLRICGLA